MPSSTSPEGIASHPERSRKEFGRRVELAVKAFAKNPGSTGLTRLLDKVEGWADEAQRTGVLDPRINWLAWTQGEAARAEVSRAHPLPMILVDRHVPIALKARALEVTRAVEAVNDDWSTLDNELRHYGGISTDVWLRAANVPGVAVFLQEREGFLTLKNRPLQHPERCNNLSPDVWAQSLGNMVARINEPRPIGQDQMRELFDAALANGWLDPNVLDAWPSFNAASIHPAQNTVRGTPLSPKVAGSLAEWSAISESHGGLLDHWRAQHREDWSTWVSPSTQTTIWRSLLANDYAERLTQWVQDDPSAVDRPVPHGRWIQSSDSQSARSLPFAGETWQHASMVQAMHAIQNKDERKRFAQWWKDPAPTLRNTVWALTQHMFPIGVPFLHHHDWYELATTIEALDLRSVLNQQADQAGGILIASPKPRARL